MLLSHLHTTLAACGPASASVMDPVLNARADPACNKPAIVIATNVFKVIPSPASKFCTSILNRTPPATATATVTQFVTATATQVSTATISTGARLQDLPHSEGGTRMLMKTSKSLVST